MRSSSTISFVSRRPIRVRGFWSGTRCPRRSPAIHLPEADALLAQLLLPLGLLGVLEAEPDAAHSITSPWTRTRLSTAMWPFTRVLFVDPR